MGGVVYPHARVKSRSCASSCSQHLILLCVLRVDGVPLTSPRTGAPTARRLSGCLLEHCSGSERYLKAEEVKSTTICAVTEMPKTYFLNVLQEKDTGAKGRSFGQIIDHLENERRHVFACDAFSSEMTEMNYFRTHSRVIRGILVTSPRRQQSLWLPVSAGRLLHAPLGWAPPTTGRC